MEREFRSDDWNKTWWRAIKITIHTVLTFDTTRPLRYTVFIAPEHWKMIIKKIQREYVIEFYTKDTTKIINWKTGSEIIFTTKVDTHNQRFDCIYYDVSLSEEQKENILSTPFLTFPPCLLNDLDFGARM